MTRKVFGCVLSFGLLLLISVSGSIAQEKSDSSQTSSISVRLVAVGDVNLGRAVGKILLAGDTCFPFSRIDHLFQNADIAFCNLESPLSDQGGETQSRRSNLVFTGPPAGADALKRAGVTIVSIANNHALDYGVDGFHQTVENLHRAGVNFVGTVDSNSLKPKRAIIAVNGLRFAFFAVTDVQNSQNRLWMRYVAKADTSLLFPCIRALRDSVDFIVLSYHGGVEYQSIPTKATRSFLHAAIDAGVDLVVGHHPHVLQEIEVYHGRYIAYSLGNFVFYQPQRYWTQRSVALVFQCTKAKGGRQIRLDDVIPLKASLRPEILQKHYGEGRKVLAHLSALRWKTAPLFLQIEQKVEP